MDSLRHATQASECEPASRVECLLKISNQYRERPAELALGQASDTSRNTRDSFANRDAVFPFKFRVSWIATPLSQFAFPLGDHEQSVRSPHSALLLHLKLDAVLWKTPRGQLLPIGKRVSIA